MKAFYTCLGIAWLATFAAAQAAAAASAAPAREPAARSLVLGEITCWPRRALERLEALSGWLVRQPGLKRLRRGRSRVVSSLAELRRLLAGKQVDVAPAGVLEALHLEALGVADIVLHEWRGGRPVYRSVIVVRKDAPFLSLTELAGRRIAFLTPNSTPGFLVPLAMLRGAGLDPVPLARHDAPVPQGKVGYVFATARVNVPFWVARGVVQAGAYSDRDWEIPTRTPQRLRRELRVLAASPPLIRSVVLVRRGLDPAVRGAVIKGLLAMGADKTAAPVRRKYYRVSRFQRIEGSAARLLAEARHYYRRVAGDVP